MARYDDSPEHETVDQRVSNRGRVARDHHVAHHSRRCTSARARRHGPLRCGPLRARDYGPFIRGAWLPVGRADARVAPTPTPRALGRDAAGNARRDDRELVCPHTELPLQHPIPPRPIGHRHWASATDRGGAARVNRGEQRHDCAALCMARSCAAPCHAGGRGFKSRPPRKDLRQLALLRRYRRTIGDELPRTCADRGA